MNFFNDVIDSTLITKVKEQDQAILNSYTINVQLFLGTIRGDNYDMHHADIVDQLITTDYYDKQFESGRKENDVIREIEDIASELLKIKYPIPPAKKLGKYILDNSLDYEYAFNIINTVTHSYDINPIEYSFNPLTCILSVKVNSSFKRSEIKKMIMEDSLEDGLFEGCIEIGKGYDYYHPLMYVDKSDKAHKLLRYIGTIDYRRESSIMIEKD